jgi:hypothetical protein
MKRLIETGALGLGGTDVTQGISQDREDSAGEPEEEFFVLFPRPTFLCLLVSCPSSASLAKGINYVDFPGTPA